MTEPPRRLPAPWTAHELSVAFIVEDANGQALAYLYFEDEPTRRNQLKRLSRDEARKVANVIAQIPELMKRPKA